MKHEHFLRAFIAFSMMILGSTFVFAEDDPVVVSGAGLNITLSQIDESGGEELYQYLDEAYRLRAIEISREVSKHLLSMEAEARGISLPELIEAEITKIVPVATESEIDEFIADQAGQIPGDDPVIRSKVGSFLQAKRMTARHSEFVASLVGKYKVKVSLPKPIKPETPRVEITGPFDKVKGPDSAPVQIVEFGDYGCVYCKRAQATINKLEEKYGDKVQLVYKHVPNRDRTGAIAAQCAAEQGKFWSFHAGLFESNDRTYEAMSGLAERNELDRDAFDSCLTSTGPKGVEVDNELASSMGINVTPVFYVNGRQIKGAQPLEVFIEAIEEELRARI